MAVTYKPKPQTEELPLGDSYTQAPVYHRQKCHASHGDGECIWEHCPQTKNRQKTCPLPWTIEED